ncbi:hypothetical protein TTHERM_000165072 (macronuclear) [Tetrahymena thermophila SB210]|uniref:Uncharacterized protein n=1 Tax=Tetrahymena thermophila (strain SB210) TaxID=312017 RepID=W7XEL7_TETTS|nr:hypothetical protein TTHERM_000165072 [Tetrahymena thermophila SB210]EWS76187.1 hypothetical protein TTHERM_000165072 [Tetrahymena thermophila SB210]|eukprot:XP_012651234.1 hypothetical protein TTHERM_000165072 [Tetrahymena thermophila SB210]
MSILIDYLSSLSEFYYNYSHHYLNKRQKSTIQHYFYQIQGHQLITRIFSNMTNCPSLIPTIFLSSPY